MHTRMKGTLKLLFELRCIGQQNFLNSFFFLFFFPPRVMATYYLPSFEKLYSLKEEAVTYR
jgi:hypothetical protein